MTKSGFERLDYAEQRALKQVFHIHEDTYVSEANLPIMLWISSLYFTKRLTWEQKEYWLKHFQSYVSKSIDRLV